MKKILFVSHCILNKASKVEQDESDLQEEYELRSKLLSEIIRQDVQMVQLPCPEFYMFGPKRWGHVKDQFDYPFYRRTCRELFSPFLEQIEAYMQSPETYRIIGIISVEGSPSCGRSLTCRGDWGGELSDLYEVQKKVQGLSMKKQMGVFMEEISAMLQEKQLRIPILTMEETIVHLCNGEKRKE